VAERADARVVPEQLGVSPCILAQEQLATPPVSLRLSKTDEDSKPHWTSEKSLVMIRPGLDAARIAAATPSD
jgi:hypothetical protein